MLVGKFFKNINQRNTNHYFSGLSFNSKNVKKNNIFFAIKGTNKNGNKYIKEAINKGATTIVSNLNFQGKKNRVLYIKTNNSRKLLSEIASKFYKKKTSECSRGYWNERQIFSCRILLSNFKIKQ